MAITISGGGGGTASISGATSGLVITDTDGALTLPSGTSAQRPASPTVGMLRFNTDEDSFEQYNGTEWGAIAGATAPTIGTVTGNIFSGASTTLSIAGTGFGAAATVRFTYSSTSTDVSVSTVSDTQLNVDVPAAVYGQAAGTVVTLSVIANSKVSNSSSKTILTLPTGGTITTAGGYRIHTFTSSGTFTIASGTTISDIEYIVVAGGAGNAAGQGGNREAGSGAGGYRSSVSGESSGGGASPESKLTLTAGAYTVTVGSGGTGQANGNNSVFSTITSLGGGWGGNNDGEAGNNGGCGGGSWYTQTVSSGTAGQGYAGGPSGGTNSWTGGGGGGAGGAGNGTGVGLGGIGVESGISGANVTYSTGGRGNVYSGASYNANGTANTGNGASGIGNGGSGIVIVRYQL